MNFNASPLLNPSQAGDIRIAPIIGIPDLLTELGVRPGRAFAKAGVDLRSF